MTEHPRIALIHATRIAIAPIETAARSLWPKAETVSLMDESLEIDRARAGQMTEALESRILALARHAKDVGAKGILFTCSAFGAAIEAADAILDVPVIKPNEAMFDAAFAYGHRVAMIYTFAPAAASMEAEFRSAAAERGSPATLRCVFAEGALDAKRAGNEAAHDQRVAEAAASITEADVIMLAQFSMASAAPAVRAQTTLPVLTSPEAAMTALRHRVEASRKGLLTC
ncbi:aspartate/glutamate racemase family protein [Roseobacter sinensis]|uniref:Aspartate/glutamate racemase family protein n=1 Tax=Roseobacter sinensis TaxID=2931391 RepID=A0ABT3BGQ7_9RHOB|nr:aspartate/glutamate racemase family protein [Roseobacter sp. WL0113]MCV3272756.1 aspartate/glutamate racemase family protein [Roseobacter sp. WL0113]